MTDYSKMSTLALRAELRVLGRNRKNRHIPISPEIQAMKSELERRGVPAKKKAPNRSPSSMARWIDGKTKYEKSLAINLPGE